MCWVRSAFRNSENHLSQLPHFWLAYYQVILGLLLHIYDPHQARHGWIKFFTCGLFSPDTTLHCIFTGAVALTSVTVDDAQFTGMTILKDWWIKKSVTTYFWCHPKLNPWQLVWRLRWMEQMYLPTPNRYFNIWVWLHLLSQMAPGKNHLLMSYASSLQPYLTTNSSNPVDPRVSVLMPYGGR